MREDYFESELSDEEILELSEGFRRYCFPQTGVNLAVFDGLMAACLSKPGYASSEPWWPLIYGMEAKKAREMLFASAAEAEAFHALVWERIISIVHALRQNYFEALYAQTLELLGNFEEEDWYAEYGDDWCLGYLQAIVLYRAEWELLCVWQESRLKSVGVAPRAAWFVCSYVSQYETAEQVAQAFLNDPARAEIRSSLPASASALRRSWVAFDRACGKRSQPGRPLSLKRKIGRNESCLCWSGRKYKWCCGQA